MADFRTADYQLAYNELHKAAFGFVEEIEKFETAEVYAAIAANRLGHESETRDALLRIAAAENVQPRLRSMTIPDDVRNELLRAAATLLTKKESAVFGISEQMQDAAAKEKPRVQVPTPTMKPNVAETAPREGGDTSPPDQKTPAEPPAPKDPPAVPLQTVAPMVPPKQQPVLKSIAAQLDEAQKAIDKGDPDAAGSIYNALLLEPRLPHAHALRVAEGLYRVRDFSGALRAFQDAGAIGPGEERFHYYYAVALFETANYGDACREIDLALPFIAVTEDVASYREKIYRAAQ